MQAEKITCSFPGTTPGDPVPPEALGARGGWEGSREGLYLRRGLHGCLQHGRLRVARGLRRRRPRRICLQETTGNRGKHGRRNTVALGELSKHKSRLPALLLPSGSWQQAGDKDEALPAIPQWHFQGSSGPSPGSK